MGLGKKQKSTASGILGLVKHIIYRMPLNLVIYVIYIMNAHIPAIIAKVLDYFCRYGIL